MQHRPRRVAFLVDLGQAPIEEILRGILRFNLDSWGGRHNPIVPMINNSVPEAFYSLLDVADPDVFYIYGELESASLEAIHSRYAPTFVTKHVAREPLDSHSYGVGLREQATIKKYLTNLREKVPLYSRRQEPCVLQLEIGESPKLSPFFLWNFGYTDSNYFAIQNHGVPGCKPTSTNDHDLLDLLGREMNLAWPINVCGDAPLARTAGDAWRYHFPIFFGPSPWNILAYWNDALTTGPTSSLHGGMKQLCLTEQIIEDEATYKRLVRLLQLKVHSGNPQKGIKMISCDTSEAELERIGKKIAQDILGTLYYGGCTKFDPFQVETAVPRRASSLFSRTGEIDYATGKEIHLSLRPPPDIAQTTEECWMVDVLIHNPEQELWYGNAAPWWQLPRKSSIVGLFNRSRPQRIIFDNRVSFEVGAREGTLDFEIPSDRKLFRYLLSPEIHYHLAADLRSTLKGPKPYEIRLSDKGRYLSGILDLSDTLRGSLYLFEHPFWRSLFQKLSRREPSKQLTEKLASDVHKLLKNTPSKDMSSVESWLTHEVIFASKQLSRATVWLSFPKIQDLYTEYVNGLSEEEKELSERDLKSDLSELTRDNVMFQGVELRCPNCIASYWYSIEEMRKSVTCRGCHVTFALPAETQWSYQLNELIRGAIGDHGLVPVLRTLARLFDRAHDSFFFMPSVEFVAYTDEEEPKVERELDLAWVKDGLFGIAEVKTTTKLFKSSDFEDLAAAAQITRPDILLIAAPEGDDEDLVKGKKAIEEKLGVKCDVWTWGPEQFKKSPFWTGL